MLLVVDVTGSYAYAGAVAGATTVANAAATIVQGRSLDRLGQFRVLPAADPDVGRRAGAAHRGGARRVAAVERLRLAIVAGLMLPPVGACVRARWSYVLDEPREVQTAYALESVVDEAVFITGPILVTALATAWDPVAGLAAAILAGVSGTLFLASQRATEPPGPPARSTADGKPQARGCPGAPWPRSRSWPWHWARCSARPR